MQLGMIGLGRMGASMVRRLLRHGHECVVHDLHPSAVASLAKDGANGSASLKEMVSHLAKPRAIWLMVPAGAVDHALADLVPLLDVGDIVIDGGNSYYRDDIRRGSELKTRGIQYLDVGTSGGVAGLERGYCLMIGGEAGVFELLRPIFSALAPGINAAAPTPGRKTGTGGPARGRALRQDGPQRHRVRRDGGVRGGFEHPAQCERRQARSTDQGRAGCRDHAAAGPWVLSVRYELPEITEVRRRGSVIGSWLLDLTASALLKDPELAQYSGRVSDSGEGRWTIQAAIDEGVPAPVLSAALYARFTSRGNADFSNRVLSAMRHEFGGHAEKPAPSALSGPTALASQEK